MAENNLERWRRQRHPRHATNIRPAETRFPRFSRAPILPIAQPPAQPPRPVLKHVPQNHHRAGSIAYAFFYGYWLPGA